MILGASVQVTDPFNPGSYDEYSLRFKAAPSPGDRLELLQQDDTLSDNYVVQRVCWTPWSEYRDIIIYVEKIK